MPQDKAGKKDRKKQIPREVRFIAFNKTAQRKKIAERKERAVKRAYERAKTAEIVAEGKTEPAETTTDGYDPQKEYYDQVFHKDTKQSKPKAKGQTQASKGGNAFGTGLKNKKAEMRWKAEEKRRIAEQAAERERQKQKARKQRERKETHKLLAARSSKGRPVIKNVVGRLLSQLESQQNP